MTKTYIIASNLAKLGKKLSVKEIKELTNEEIEKIDSDAKKVDSFNALWGMVEKRLGEPYNWIEWRQSTGLLNSCLKDHRVVLKESFVNY